MRGAVSDGRACEFLDPVDRRYPHFSYPYQACALRSYPSILRSRLGPWEVSRPAESVMAMPIAHATGVRNKIIHDGARNGAATYLQSRLSAKVCDADENFEIPIIGLTPSFSAPLEDCNTVAAQFHQASTTSGLFYVTSHQIPKQPVMGSCAKPNGLCMGYRRARKRSYI
jgi:hypothetical protein